MRTAYIALMLSAACAGSGGPTGTSAAASSSTGGTSGGTTTGTAGGTTGNSQAACTPGATITLPACSSSPGSAVEVPAGCKPTVDGAYKEGEWGDAACVTIGSDPVYVKYSGTMVYFAWSMTPSCGCEAQLVFNPNGSTTLDGSQFDLGIFDDPFGSNGDANEIDSLSGDWASPGKVSTGIVIRNPANQPTPVTYELAVPFSKLGLTTGQKHSIGFGLYHLDNGQWPAGLTVPNHYPADPTQWGQLSSSANWQ